MTKLNRAQRIALKALFDRGPIFSRKFVTVKLSDIAAHPHISLAAQDYLPRVSYREFRATVAPLLAGGGCVLVPWKGMTVGIEPDGYTHT